MSRRALFARLVTSPPPSGRRAIAPAQRDAAAAGTRSRPRRQPVGHVARVSAERLVAAVAVERDRHVLARQLREVEAGDRGGVGERLAVVAHDLRDDLDRVGPHDELVVVGAEQLGDLACVRQLVEVVVIEADRERLHRAAARLRHRGDDGGRVDAARQEGSERHVGDQPAARRGADVLEDRLVQLARVLDLELAGVVEPPVAVERELPVARAPACAPAEACAPREDRERRGDVPVGEEAVDRPGVELPRDRVVLEQRAQLGRERSIPLDRGRRRAASCRPGPAPAAAAGGVGPRARTRTCRAGAARSRCRAPRRGAR